MSKVKIINTGEELLMGYTQNSHLGYINQKLLNYGISCKNASIVSDDDEIYDCFQKSLINFDIIMITGGLGPTNDDVTLQMIAKVMKLNLQASQKVADQINSYLLKQNIKNSKNIKKQSNILKPDDNNLVDIFINDYGTAPGFYIKHLKKNKSKVIHIFILPGPPREFKPMFNKKVIPIINNLFNNKITKTFQIKFKTFGLPESKAENIVMKSLKQNYPDYKCLNITTCTHNNHEVDFIFYLQENQIKLITNIIKKSLGNNIISHNADIYNDYKFTYNELSLEKKVIELLTKKQLRLTTAESCTGGHIFDRLTNISGSSKVVFYGFNVYSNEAKVNILNVSQKTIDLHGAVSNEVATELANNSLKISKSDLSISITGIAGPTGGSNTKPVGTAFIALAQKNKPTITKHFYRNLDRLSFKEVVSSFSLDLIRRELIT